MSAALGPVLAAITGVLTWTLFEYIIHRWFGHDRRFGRTPFGIEHKRHHVEGDYFAPTWKKATFAVVVTAVAIWPAMWIAGAANGLAYVISLMSFYMAYELLHRRLHTHAGIGPHGLWARKHHFRHHLVDGRTNFGVTTPLWDVVFRTYRRPPEVIQVPQRLAMRWLLDPATGGVRADQAGRFALKPSR